VVLFPPYGVCAERLFLVRTPPLCMFFPPGKRGTSFGGERHLSPNGGTNFRGGCKKPQRVLGVCREKNILVPGKRRVFKTKLRGGGSPGIFAPQKKRGPSTREKYAQISLGRPGRSISELSEASLIKLERLIKGEGLKKDPGEM